MEYIEYDIKQKIEEILHDRIVTHSVELNCELIGTSLNRIYGSNVYYKDEVNGFIEVIADFNCKLVDVLGNKTEEKGTFTGNYNVDQKHFEDSGNYVNF